MRFLLVAVRSAAGLLLGLGLGLVVTSPTVSAKGVLPSLLLASPGNGSNVSGNITFVAVADAAGLVSLQFKVDGNDYGSAITAGPCRASFSTGSVPDGPHTVQAEGLDEFGNTVVSYPATMFVNNLAPSISNVAVFNITASSATVAWTTAAVADGQVEFGPTPSYGSASARDFTMATSHAQTLTGLTAGTTYYFRALSVGQNGILNASGTSVFTTSGAPGNPTPTPTPTPGPTPPTTPGPTPTPTPTPGPTPRPTPTPAPSPTQPAQGSQSGHSTTLPTIRPHVPQVVLTESGAVVPVTSGDTPMQGRLSPASAAMATATRSGSTSTKAAKTATTSIAVSSTTISAAPIAATSGKSRPIVSVSGTSTCKKPDPFAAAGGVGLCVDGTWLELWKSPARGGGKGK